MNSIKGLLFDKDGTLFDFEATWASWAASLFRSLVESEEKANELGKAVGFDLDRQSFQPGSVVVAGTPAEIAKALSSHLPNLSTPELLHFMNEAAENAPQAEATPLIPLLTRLGENYKLGISTNDAEVAARAHLKSASIDGFFDFIAGYDSGFGAKPEPGMQIAFCEATNLEPHEVAMVGDSTHDLIAGRSAQMITVGVLTGLATKADLAPYADVVFPSIADLPEWLSIK